MLGPLPRPHLVAGLFYARVYPTSDKKCAEIYKFFPIEFSLSYYPNPSRKSSECLRDSYVKSAYVLEGHTPRRARSRREHAQFMRDKAQRQICWTDLGDVGYVSTIFLGRDTGEVAGVPILFETMARIGADYSDQVTRRYATYHDAIAGHAELVTEHYEAVRKNNRTAKLSV